MAKKVITNTILTCDICEKEVTEFAKSREYSGTVVSKLTLDTYYVGEEPKDICKECSDAIIEFLKGRGMK